MNEDKLILGSITLLLIIQTNTLSENIKRELVKIVNKNTNMTLLT
jgi:hypothetical protein